MKSQIACGKVRNPANPRNLWFSISLLGQSIFVGLHNIFLSHTFFYKFFLQVFSSFFSEFIWQTQKSTGQVMKSQIACGKVQNPANPRNLWNKSRELIQWKMALFTVCIVHQTSGVLVQIGKNPLLYLLCGEYGNTGCGVFKRVVKI